MKKQKINNKEVKRRTVEEAAERLAQILIMQIELSRKENPNNGLGLNFKKDIKTN